MNRGINKTLQNVKTKKPAINKEERRRTDDG